VLFTEISSRRGDDRSFADRDFSPLSNRLPHIVFADEVGWFFDGRGGGTDGF
jgi:hypothetical protein